MATEHRKYLSRGLRSMLDQVPINDGKLRFTTDTGQLFMDTFGTRIEITDFVKDYTEDQIKQILAPLPKFYFSSDTFKFFIHDGENWICLDKSGNADHATNADTATYAINASTSDYSTNASTAEYAINADTAVYAQNAENASTANYAENANESVNSEYAVKDANGNQINTTYAPLASPIFTGTPSAPTPAEGTNDQQIANTAFVVTAIANAMAQITGFDTNVVSVLPESGEKGIIYFTPSENPEEDNSYIEYIWDGTKFEKIGDTKIDLSSYLHEVEVSGTGNAVTGMNYENGKLILKKDSTFLTSHPSITTNSSTGTETPNAGETFQVVDNVTTDANGHVTSFRLKTVTLPNTVNKATNADTATYATSADTANKDGSGNQIDETYIKNADVSGKTITFTRGNNTTFSFNTQDNNTTYADYKGATTADAGIHGLVPPASSENKDKFLRGDGIWATPLNSGTSLYASQATNADTATYAVNASTANYSNSAASATNASTSDYADRAKVATNASTANYATNAGSALNASSSNYSSVASKAQSIDSEADFDYGDLDEELG